MSEIEDVLIKIEELRDKLNKIAEGKRLIDPEVVSTSQMLDVLLNEYYKLMKSRMKNLKK
jgi:stage 0 sporulation regulatory protein